MTFPPQQGGLQMRAVVASQRDYRGRMRVYVIVGSAILLAASLTLGGQASYQPSPGHLVVSNGLTPSASGCVGSVQLAYGFLPNQATRSWEARPLADCSVDVFERAASPGNSWRPVGPVKVLLTLEHNGQTFSKDTIFSYPVLPCNTDPIKMTSDYSNYSPSSPWWATWGNDGGDNCWKWSADFFNRHTVFGRYCDPTTESDCIQIDMLNGALSTHAYCKADYWGGIDPPYTCQPTDEDGLRIPNTNVNAIANVQPGATADLLRGAG